MSCYLRVCLVIHCRQVCVRKETFPNLRWFKTPFGLDSTLRWVSLRGAHLVGFWRALRHQVAHAYPTKRACSLSSLGSEARRNGTTSQYDAVARKSVLVQPSSSIEWPNTEKRAPTSVILNLIQVKTRHHNWQLHLVGTTFKPVSLNLCWFSWPGCSKQY